MKPLRIALTKGRLEKSTVELFEQIGLDCSCLRDKGRKLILPVGDGELEAVLAKAPDVITYVEHGVCDLGVVGKDTIMEHGSHFFEILDLGFGRCGFALAAPAAWIFTAAIGKRQWRPNIPMWPDVFLRARKWTCVSSGLRAPWSWLRFWVCLMELWILWKRA